VWWLRCHHHPVISCILQWWLLASRYYRPLPYYTTPNFLPVTSNDLFSSKPDGINLTFLYRSILILWVGRCHRILVGLTWLNRPVYCYTSSDTSHRVLILDCACFKNAHPFLVVQGLFSRSACTERLVLEFPCSTFRPSVQPVTSCIIPCNSSNTDYVHSSLELSRMIVHMSCFKGEETVWLSTFVLLRCHAAFVGTYRRFGTSYQGSSLTLADGTDGLSRNDDSYILISAA
jgi:hypothetical protein